MGIDINSYFEFDFSNVDMERKGNFQREMEQKFLNWYSYSPSTLLTRFEMHGNSFTAEIIGTIRPEEIAYFFNIGQIDIKVVYAYGGVMEETIKIVDGEIIEQVEEIIDLDEIYNNMHYDAIDFRQVWEEIAANDILCNDILRNARDKFYS